MVDMCSDLLVLHTGQSLDDIPVKGTVSQIFYLGPRLYSIQSRNNIQINKYKVTRFFYKQTYYDKKLF